MAVSLGMIALGYFGGWWPAVVFVSGLLALGRAWLPHLAGVGPPDPVAGALTFVACLAGDQLGRWLWRLRRRGKG